MIELIEDPKTPEDLTFNALVLLHRHGIVSPELIRETPFAKGETMECPKCFGNWSGTLRCPFCHVKDLEAKIQRLEDDAVRVRGYIHDTAERTHIRIQQLEEKVSNSFGMVGKRGRKIDELNFKVQQLEEKLSDQNDLMDSVRDEARDQNPRGITISDLMKLWNGQYEAQIVKQRAEIERLEVEAGARDTAGLSKSRLENKIKEQEKVIERYRESTGNKHLCILRQEGKIKEQEAEIDRLNDSANSRQSEAHSQIAKIKEQEAEIEQLKDSEACVRIERYGYGCRVKGQEEKIKQLRNMIDAYSKSMEFYDFKIKEYKKRIKKQEAETERSKTKVTESEPSKRTIGEQLYDSKALCAWYKDICDKLCKMLSVNWVSSLPYAVEKLKEEK